MHSPPSFDLLDLIVDAFDEECDDSYSDGQQLYEDVGSFASKEEALKHIEIREKARYKYKTSSHTRNHRRTTYMCTSHVDCSHEVCSKKSIGSAFGVEPYCVAVRGTHASERAATTRTGISPVIKSDVDTLILVLGHGKCREALKRKYRYEPNKLLPIPTVNQLKARTQSLRLKIAGKPIEVFASLTSWAMTKMCITTEQIFGHMSSYDPECDQQRFQESSDAFKNQLLGLRTFQVVSDGVETIGIVVSSRALLRNVCKCIEAQGSDGVFGSADGTYKLHNNGWTLGVFGSICVAFDRNAYVHRFVPWAYMFTRTETKDAYVQLFAAVKTSILRFFGKTLILRWASLDHSWPIRNALKEVWPDVIPMTCWPHISRNARDKKHLLVDKLLYDDLIYPQIVLLHHSRSMEQFLALAKLFLRHWENVGEARYAKWFQDQYANATWCYWFVSCSGVGGLTPNQNPIESYHNSMKSTAVLSGQATTSWVLNVSLDSILQHGADIQCTSASIVCAGPIPQEVLLECRLLVAKSNHKLLRVREGEPPVAILFNAPSTMVSDGSVNGVKVTANRIKVFTLSMKGRLKPGEPSANVPLLYQSLHYFQIRGHHNTYQPATGDATRNHSIGRVQAWPSLVRSCHLPVHCGPVKRYSPWSLSDTCF